MHPINLLCENLSLMASYNWEREKAERSKGTEEIFVEPSYTRHWAGSSAYMCYALNVHNDPVHA